MYEAAWQDEFYRCLYLCRPANARILPEFGAGSTKAPDGFVAFHLNSSLKWAFELVRKRRAISEHLDRFKVRKVLSTCVAHACLKVHGSYYDLVTGNQISQWLVIDFRSIHKCISVRDEHLVHVRYNDDMTVFTIDWGLGKTKTITLTAGTPQNDVDECIAIMQRAREAAKEALDPDEYVDLDDREASLPYAGRRDSF